MGLHELLNRVSGFQWDAGNIQKNRDTHQVSSAECEQLFFNRPQVAAADPAHSHDEERLFALGRSDRGRFLFVAFTVRNDLIRVISARDMSRKERKVYERDG
jgi:uncharacterized protein